LTMRLVALAPLLLWLQCGTSRPIYASGPMIRGRLGRSLRMVPKTSLRRCTIRAEENLSEDQLRERLKEAEDQAAALRARLVGNEVPSELPDLKKEPVTSSDDRIVNTNPLKRGGRQGNNMAGPSEADILRELKVQEDEEAGAEIRRRFLLAFGGTVVFGGLAFVPTTSHKVPKEPASVFLTPVYRSQYLLEEIEYTIEKGRWKKEIELLGNVLGKPNYLKENIQKAAQCLVADDDWREADGVGRELVENIKALDYKEFFQAESPNAEQAKFLQTGIGECRRKLDQFLSLMPADQIRIAKDEAIRTKPAVARDTLDYEE